MSLFSSSDHTLSGEQCGPIETSLSGLVQPTVGRLEQLGHQGSLIRSVAAKIREWDIVYPDQDQLINDKYFFVRQYGGNYKRR